MELPKHTTQVGTIPANKKLYVEDYCISYKKQLDDLYPGERKQIALYGTFKKEKNVEYAFAYGAALLGKGKGRTDSLTATQKEEAENFREQYFPDYQLVGLIIASDGVDETLYWLGSGSKSIPVDGYYIFYDQNEMMLNFMMENQNEERAIDMDPVIVKKADMDREKRARKEKEEREKLEARQSAGSYRKKLQVAEGAEEKKKGTNRFPLAAGLVLVTILSIYGVRTYYPDMHLGDIKSTVSDWLGKASLQTGKLLNADTSELLLLEGENGVGTHVDIATTEMPIATQMPPAPADLDVVVIPDFNAITEGDDATQGNVASSEGAVVPEQNQEVTQEVQQPVEEKPAEPVEYLIQRGDNLLRILRTHYGDESKLQEICVVNNIKDPNNIQVGQTILLP